MRERDVAGRSCVWVELRERVGRSGRGSDPRLGHRPRAPDDGIRVGAARNRSEGVAF